MKKVEKKSPVVDATPFALTLDMEKYLGQLTDWEMSEEQKRQLIRALWDLLVSCAEIGLKIHPLQTTKSTCGQLSYSSSKPALTAPNKLYLDDLILPEELAYSGSDASSEKELIEG